MKQKTLFGAFLIILMLVIVWGITMIFPKDSVKEMAEKKDKINVTASFYPLYFFASEIGMDKVSVVNMTPVGVEPHDYEPTARDIATVQEGKVLILNGGGFEAWAENIKAEMKGSGVIVVEVGKDLFTNGDPHIWMSPKLAKSIAEKILDSLSQVDPTNESYYKENYEFLLSRLTDLQYKYQKGLSTCSKRNVVVSHEAFGYLTGEFGLTQVAISGLSPEEEPSAKRLAEVANFAKDNGIKYIFFETLLSPELSETIASEVGAQTLVLNPLEGLSDAEQETENYFTIMEDNLANLRIALECQ